MIHEFPHAIHPGITSSSWGRLLLKAVPTSDKCVEVRLNSHPTKLLPAFHRIHRCPTVGIAVDEQHRTARQVKGELFYGSRFILVATLRIRDIRSVCECVCRIDRDRPLHVAGKLVEVVDRPIRTAFRAGGAH